MWDDRRVLICSENVRGFHALPMYVVPCKLRRKKHTPPLMSQDLAPLMNYDNLTRHCSALSAAIAQG